MLTPDQVQAILRSTFEEMAFLDVAEGPIHIPPTSREGPWLSLSYSHPTSGVFALFLPKPTRYAVAGAIYGEDREAVTSDQLDDSLLELMNVLAGRLLTERFGAASTYSMGLPTVVFDSPGNLPGFAGREFSFHHDNDDSTLVWYEVPA